MTERETILFFINRLIPFFRNDIPCLQIPMYHLGIRIVTRDFVKYVHELGKKIHVWTINDEAKMIDLIDIEVDGIMTDRPKILKKILKSKSLWA